MQIINKGAKDVSSVSNSTCLLLRLNEHDLTQREDVSPPCFLPSFTPSLFSQTETGLNMNKEQKRQRKMKGNEVK